MPYIEQKTRQRFDPVLKEIKAQSPGELNYLITRLCDDYLNQGVKNYQRHNDVMGVLESAKQEFYRRVVAAYEYKKQRENGDVYK